MSPPKPIMQQAMSPPKPIMQQAVNPPKPPIMIREVYSYNLESEFSIIRGIIKQYPYISVDSEFPGTLYRHVPGSPTTFCDRSAFLYHYLRSNVNDLKLIQLGLTFSDAGGNLPDIDGAYAIWEFNFEFCLCCDRYVPESIDLLMKNGIDFNMNYHYGIDPELFGHLMVTNDLVMNESAKWITFHGAYDFGYLLKMIYRQDLPEDFDHFMTLFTSCFGNMVYDVKHLMKFCGSLFGGLEQLAKSLNVDRAVGNCHEAASDSLLTLHTFLRLKEIFFPDGADHRAGVVYGLS